MAKNLNMTEFKQLYEGWQDSHLSVREYCASISFDENKFYYWKKKLEDSNLPTPASFVPIQMNQRGGRISISGQRPASSGKDDCCEIIYPNGVTLRIKNEMTPNVLRSLITLIQ
jgi:hypothetical protein